VLRRSSSEGIARRAACEGTCKDVVSGGVEAFEAAAT
jgi:hypothetical protein